MNDVVNSIVKVAHYRKMTTDPPVVENMSVPSPHQSPYPLQIEGPVFAEALRTQTLETIDEPVFPVLSPIQYLNQFLLRF